MVDFEFPSHPPDREPSARRHPYEKPRVTFREPLEGVAAVCNPPTGKGNPIDCTIGSS